MKTRNLKLILCFLSLTLSSGLLAAASTALGVNLNIQGKLFQADGVTAVTDSAVEFRISVFEGSCKLYEETHPSINMSSDNSFSLKVGDAGGSFATGISTINDVFKNDQTVTTCMGGSPTSHVINSSRNRTLEVRVSTDAWTTNELFSEMKVNAAPFAQEAFKAHALGSINNIDDVYINAPANGDLLIYKTGNTRFENVTPSTSGIRFDSIGVGVAVPSTGILEVANDVCINGGACLSSSGNLNSTNFDDGDTNINVQDTSDHITFSTTGSEAMRISNTGNVGIGTNAPNNPFEVATSNIPKFIVNNTGNVGIGSIAPSAKFEVQDGIGNSIFKIKDTGHFYQDNVGLSTFIGYGAGDSDDLTNNYNIAIGYNALNLNTNGTNNVAIGHLAASENTAGLNVAIGSMALKASTSGNYNVAVGKDALKELTGGFNNVAVGSNAGNELVGGGTTTSNYNSVFIGKDTKSAALGQNNEIVIGHQAEGLGTDTVVIGNDDIALTYLQGNVSMEEASVDYTVTAAEVRSPVIQGDGVGALVLKSNNDEVLVNGEDPSSPNNTNAIFKLSVGQSGSQKQMRVSAKTDGSGNPSAEIKLDDGMSLSVKTNDGGPIEAFRVSKQGVLIRNYGYLGAAMTVRCSTIIHESPSATQFTCNNPMMESVYDGGADTPTQGNDVFGFSSLTNMGKAQVGSAICMALGARTPVTVPGNVSTTTSTPPASHAYNTGGVFSRISSPPSDYVVSVICDY